MFSVLETSVTGWLKLVQLNMKIQIHIKNRGQHPQFYFDSESLMLAPWSHSRAGNKEHFNFIYLQY